jgi:DNA repair protein RadC
LMSAAAVILVHNHPSGDCAPSENDLAFTRAARDACALFGIRLFDHIIVGKNAGESCSLAARSRRSVHSSPAFPAAPAR